jgi:hypothetical protein
MTVTGLDCTNWSKMEDNIILTPRFIEYVQEYTRTFAYYSFEVIISFVTLLSLLPR